MGSFDRTMTDQGKKYFAFISYKREDVKWADWLRRKLEHYRLPSSLRKQDASLPKEIRPVFRDMLELSGGLLAEEINEALRQSRYLIVICSPRAAQSPWVDKEVKTFIELGRARDIIPFIIKGKPFSDDPDTECFTPTLRSLKGDEELLGININEMGRDAAAVKVVARMFDLMFDTLWKRYERWKNRRRMLWGGFFLSLSLLGLAVGVYIAQKNRELSLANDNLEKANRTILVERDRANQERDFALAVSDSLRIANDSIIKQRDIILMTYRKLRETHWSMLGNQSLAVAEKAMGLIAEGDSYTALRLAAEILPQNPGAPDRPYVPEAEMVLRKASLENNAVLNSIASCVTISDDGRRLISSYADRTEGDVKVWDISSGRLIKELPVCKYDNPSYPFLPGVILISPDNNTLFISSALDRNSALWDIESGEFLRSLNPDIPHDPTLAVAFRQDGTTICEGKKNTLLFWSTETGELISKQPIQSGELMSVCFDGMRQDFLAVSLRNGKFWVSHYDPTSGKLRDEYELNHGPVQQVFWTVLGKAPSLACQVKTKDGVQIWAWNLKRNVIVFKDESTYAYSACFSPDGSSLFAISTTDHGSVLTEWDVKEGKQLRQTAFADRGLASISMSPHGDRLALYGEGIRLVDLGAQERILPVLGGKAVLSPKGDVFATNHNGQILLYDTETATLTKRYDCGFRGGFSFSPDGRFIAMKIRLSGSDLPEYRVIDLKKDIVYDANTLADAGIDAVMFELLPSPCLLNSSLANKMTSTWEESSYDPVSMSFDAEHNRIAVSLRQVTNHYDGFLQLWDCKKESPLTPVMRASSDEFGRVGISPDGKRIVTDAPNLRIWDPFTGQVLKEFPDLAGECSFSPDGKSILLSHDTKVQVADAETGGVFFEFDGAHTICCPPSGRFMILSSDDNTWLVNYPSLQELLSMTRERYRGSPLSVSEKNKYFLTDF